MPRDEWKPSKKQAIFLSIPFTVKEAFYGGGAGSGKSDLLLMFPIVHQLYKNPEFKQVFMRRTFPELKNEIVGRTHEIYPRFGATYNKSDKIWTFPRPDQFGGQGLGNSGAQIFLSHCENEKDVHNFDSMQVNLYTPDELTSYTQTIYEYITFERVRARNGSGLCAIVRGAGMPGGIGHTWVKKRFIDPKPEGSTILVGKGGNKRIYIHSTLADNPHIDPNYAQSLEGRPEAEKRAKKYGDWNAYLGQVFDEFREKHYQDESDNALHVVEPFEIPSFWPKVIVGDWGYRAQTYILYGAISPNRRLYLYREQSWRFTKIEEWAPEVAQYIKVELPREVKFCKSVGYEQGQEHTIQEQIEAALGIGITYPNQGSGSRVAGKQLLHEYFRWKPRPIIRRDPSNIFDEAHAQYLFRIKGEQAYREYVKIFEPEVEENNLPKLQIFNTCPLLIEAIKAASYDKPKDNKPAEDVAEFDGDDPYDVCRYMVDTVDRYFQEANEEMKKAEKQQAIQNQLNNTQDMTAFYRNMRKLESDSRPKHVMLFHRRRSHV